MIMLLFINVAVLLILLWLLNHLVNFYKGVLREKESKSKLLPWFKIFLPLAIIGVGTHIIILVVLMIKTIV